MARKALKRVPKRRERFKCVTHFWLFASIKPTPIRKASSHKATVSKDQVTSEMELDVDTRTVLKSSAKSSSIIDSDGEGMPTISSTPPTSDPVDHDVDMLFQDEIKAAKLVCISICRVKVNTDKLAFRSLRV